MNLTGTILRGLLFNALPTCPSAPLARSALTFSTMNSHQTTGTNGRDQSPVQDVLIIGGGPAGLSVATGLARQLYTATVFDSGVYRNARSDHMHNVAGWDHQSPAAFRVKAREDLAKRYQTVHFEDSAIEAVRKTADGLFEADDSNGRIWTGRKLMLAAGVRDIYPALPGYEEVWGRGVFRCLFCHGFEESDSTSAGVLAIGDLANPKFALHMAYMARRLAKAVIVYTDGADDVAEQVALGIKPGLDISVERRKIERLSRGHKESEVVVHLAGGESQIQGFITHRPKTEVNGPFARQLALELTEAGDIKTTGPFHETSMPGVFAAGDAATYMKAVTSALSMGALAAGGLASQLQMLPPSL